MGNPFKGRRRPTELLLALAVIFFTIGYYYLIYIPSKEGAIIERKFRTLQSIDLNMREKLGGYESLLSNFIKSVESGTENQSDQAMKQWKKDYKSKAQLLDSMKILQNFLSIYNENNLQIRIDARYGDTTESLKGKFITDLNPQQELILTKHSNTTTLYATTKITFDRFIDPLFRKNIFNYYLIIDKEKVIYESDNFSSGLRWSNPDSLFNSSNNMHTSKMVKHESGGITYAFFLHPIRFFRDKEWAIAGLLKNETLESEKRVLPEDTLTTLTFVAICLLLLLPFIKLMTMGKRERLSFTDLALSYVCVMLLCSFAFFSFVKYNFRFISASEDSDSKKYIANKISGSLCNEIRSAILLLRDADSLRYRDTVLRKSISNIYSENKILWENKTTLAQQSQEAVKQLMKKYRSASQIFWLDSTGLETTNWTSIPLNYPASNYKQRTYFQDVKNNKTLSVPGLEDQKFSISQVTSWVDGRYKTTLSIPSVDKGMVAVISCFFESVTNPVLPLGYQFAISDQNGKVIYHSDTTHNGGENLMDEFSNTDELWISLKKQTCQSYKSDYNGHSYMVNSEPVKGLPYQISILSDNAYQDTRNLQCFIFTMMMLFSLFFFLCLEIFMVFLCNINKSTRLVKNKFNLSWTHPKADMGFKYRMIFDFQVLLILQVLIFCTSGLLLDFAGLTDFVFAIVYSALLSSVYALSIKRNESGEVSLVLPNASVILIFLLVFVTGAAYCYQLFQILFLFVPVALFSGFLIFRYSKKKVEKVIYPYVSSFRWLIFSRVLLTSGLPVLFFYICSYNFEQRLNSRDKLLTFARDMESHFASTDELIAEIENLSDDSAIHSVYPDSSWIGRIAIARAQIQECTYDKRDKISIKLLNASRIHYLDYADSRGSESCCPCSNDSTYQFNSIFSGRDIMGYSMSTMGSSGKPLYLTLGSSIPMYTYPLPWPPHQVPKALVYILIFIGSLFLLYQLIRYAINKLFGLEVAAGDEHNEITRKEQLSPDFMYTPDIRFYFVQGPPGAWKNRVIKKALKVHFDEYDKYINPDHRHYQFFDLITIPDETMYQKESWDDTVKKLCEDEKMDAVVLNHFEYNVNDDHTSRRKLNLIEQLMNHKTRVVIIVSTIEPSIFLESLEKYSRDTEDNKKLAAVQEDMQRWRILLGHYMNFYLPMYKNSNPHSGNPLTDYIDIECRYGHFMHRIREVLTNTTRYHENVSETYQQESVILQTQGLAHHFYNSIWNSLTREEQIALYDLAEEGLMNIAHHLTINLLLIKGLILRENGQLMLMNKSFRNYILTNTHTREIRKLEKQIEDGPTWQNFRVPMLILLFGVIWLILFSNPDKFGQVLPVISVIIGGVPAITKLISFFTPGEKLE